MTHRYSFHQDSVRTWKESLVIKKDLFKNFLVNKRAQNHTEIVQKLLESYKTLIILSHSAIVSWSAYELFSRPSYKRHLVAFRESFKLTKERSRRYPAQTITDADYADDTALLANTPAQAETLLHSLERAAAGIGLHVNAHKTEYICFNQTGDISTLKSSSLKLVDKFIYQGGSVSSTETDINTWLAKAWTAFDRLSVKRKSDLTDKMKRSFFQAAVVSILLYGCTTWMLTKRMEKKLDGNYTRMLRAILNKSWRQHPTKQQLYGHLPPITKTIQDMQDTAGEVGTKSQGTYSCGPLHIDEQRQDDQPEPTYNSSVPIRGVTLRTCRKLWTIEKGGERGSGISVFLVRQDDDDLGQPMNISADPRNFYLEK